MLMIGSYSPGFVPTNLSQLTVSNGATFVSGVNSVGNIVGASHLKISGGATVIGTLSVGSSALFLQDVTIGAAKNLTIGTTLGNRVTDALAANVQVLGTSYNASSVEFLRFVNSAGLAPSVIIGKSRSATVAGYTTVATADTLGNISMVGVGTDAAAFSSAINIQGKADGTIGSAVVPGKLILQTANGSGTMTDGMSIDSNQAAVFVNSVGISGILSIGNGVTAINGQTFTHKIPMMVSGVTYFILASLT